MPITCLSTIVHCMNLKPNISGITYSPTMTKICLWVLAIVVVGLRLFKLFNPGFAITAEISIVAQLSLCVVALSVLITMSPVIRINRTLGLFVVVGLLSLILNDSIGDTTGYERLAYFVLMATLFSPLASSPSLTQFKNKAWRLLIWGLRISIVVNFILYLSWEINHEPQRFFRGNTGHGMMLGVLAMVVLLDTMWQLLKGKSLGRVKWIAYGGLLAMSAILVVSSGSRCALAASVVGMIPMIVTLRRQKLKLIWAVVVASLIILGFSVSQLRTFEGIKYKTSLALEHGSLTYSRNHLWQARINEFSQNPMLGIGFGITTEQPVDDVYKYNKDTNLRHTTEPGSSWLNVLSTTGLTGFLLIMIFNLKLFLRLKRHWNLNRETVLYMSLLIALWLHGCFEGWLLYAGSVTFMIYWLLTSQIMNLSTDSKSQK